MIESRFVSLFLGLLVMGGLIGEFITDD